MSFTRLGVALFALLLGPAALAKPVVTVSVGLPQVVVAPPAVVVAPAPVVVAQPRCPGPNRVWVDGSWRNDVYGRPIWVAGHCAVRPVVVQRVVTPAPPPRTVIIHRY